MIDWLVVLDHYTSTNSEVYTFSSVPESGRAAADWLAVALPLTIDGCSLPTGGPRGRFDRPLSGAPVMIVRGINVRTSEG